MCSSPATRASLLVGIRDPQDRLAWGQFVQIYAPLIHGYGLRRGLQDADSADLTQEVLRRIARSAPGFRYDPEKGSFRGWLYAVTRNALRKMAARKAGQAVTGDTEVRRVLEQHPDRRADEEHWEREYQRGLFRWAAGQVRAEFRAVTWEAFWRTAVVGEDIDEVALALGVSTGAVYIARSRVSARIRQQVRAVERE